MAMPRVRLQKKSVVIKWVILHDTRVGMRRFVCLIIVLLLPLALRSSRAEEGDAPGDVLAPCYIVVDASDPTIVLYERDADERCVPGSTMKIMTCILVLEQCADLEQTVVVTGQAAALKETNSLMDLIRGETLTVRDLLYGLMLESGNDAALLLAQTVSGSVEAFAALMNEKAASLGMTGTHFVNASGAYKSGQFSTARDMAVLTCYAMQNELFRDIVSTVTYTVEPNGVRKRALVMTNSNKLISDPADSRLYYEYADGVKTGSTAQGGKCLVASASRDGASVVAVMLGALEGGSKLDRMSRVFEDAKAVMDLTLTARYEDVTGEALGLSYQTEAPVDGADVETVPLIASFGNERVRLSDVQIAAIKASPAVLTAEAKLDPVSIPVRSGDVCGSVTFSLDGRALFTVPLVAAADVQPAATAAAFVTALPMDTPAPEASDTAEPGVVSYVVVAVLALTALMMIIFLRSRGKRGRR